MDESVGADEEDEEEVGGVDVGLCAPAGEDEDEEDEGSRDRLIRATRAAIASWMTVLPWLVVLYGCKLASDGENSVGSAREPAVQYGVVELLTIPCVSEVEEELDEDSARELVAEFWPLAVELLLLLLLLLLLAVVEEEEEGATAFAVAVICEDDKGAVGADGMHAAVWV